MNPEPTFKEKVFAFAAKAAVKLAKAAAVGAGVAALAVGANEVVPAAGAEFHVPVAYTAQIVAFVVALRDGLKAKGA